MAMVFGPESCERFLQSNLEIYANNCRLSIICFSKNYDIVDENIVTRSDFSRFPNATESGILMSRSLCAL